MQLATNDSAITQSSRNFTPLPLAERNRLIEEALALVESLAVDLLRVHRFPIACDDLVSCGMRALVEAAASFDPTRAVQFSTFAYWRVRGAMLDANRNGQGLCSRSEMTRMLKEAAAKGRQLGRRHRPRLHRITCRAGDFGTGFVPRQCEDDSIGELDSRTDPDAMTPETSAEVACLQARVRKGIAALAPRQRQVLELLYYHHEGSYEAVAKVLGVGRPHVFRLHARALTRLREHLADLAAQ